MNHPIDPLVDFAFKRLFATPDNLNLLVHFLNAVLALASPIVGLRVLDPSLHKQTGDAKLCVLDLLAVDAEGRRVQVEVQLALHPGIRPRMVFNLCALYQAQLAEGQDYALLQPAYAVWILRAPLFRETAAAHHRFRLVDPDSGLTLTDHLNVHVLELTKFHLDHLPLDAREQWIYFLREAHNWKQLPPHLRTPELTQAMSTLKTISDKTDDYLLYLSRLDEITTRLTIERSHERTLAAMEEAQAQLAELQAREAEAKAREAEAKAREAEAKEREAEAKEREAELQALVAELQEREAELQEREARALQERAEKDAEIAALRALLARSGP